MDITGALSEAITAALKKNSGRSMLIAIPLALAPRAANDFAKSNRLSIKTAEEIISDASMIEKIEGEGLLIYEYFPSFTTKEENELFMTHLRAYRGFTKKPIILFILLTQDAPLPNPSILRVAWATGLFKRGELYEVVATWQKISLLRLRLASFCLIPFGWRKKQFGEWETLLFEQDPSVKQIAIVSTERDCSRSNLHAESNLNMYRETGREDAFYR
jgi:hypothetical protein